MFLVLQVWDEQNVSHAHESSADILDGLLPHSLVFSRHLQVFDIIIGMHNTICTYTHSLPSALLTHPSLLPLLTPPSPHSSSLLPSLLPLLTPPSSLLPSLLPLLTPPSPHSSSLLPSSLTPHSLLTPSLLTHSSLTPHL